MKRRHTGMSGLHSLEYNISLSTSDLTGGTLSTDRFSAYSDLSAEGYLDNSADTDLLTRSQADSVAHGNAGLIFAVEGETGLGLLWHFRWRVKRILRPDERINGTDAVGVDFHGVALLPKKTV
jgi:hypothetical protein